MEHKSTRDSELISQGWTRRFSASRPRLDEAAEQYRELGFEVLLEPVATTPSPSEESCTSCFFEDPDFVRVIYTRPNRND